MAIYDGVVTLDTTDIPVLVELDEAYVRMSAGGSEIGQWPAEECDISHVADATYAITAEDETLQFVPNQPSLFAAAINGATPTTSVPLPPEPQPEMTPSDGMKIAPPPKPLTMGLFYALCVATLSLALWALIRMIF